MAKKIGSIFILIIVFILLPGTGEAGAFLERTSFFLEPYYTRLDPDQINDSISASKNWVEEMEGELVQDVEADIEETMDDHPELPEDPDQYYIMSEFQETLMVEDKLESTYGLKAGFTHSIPDFWADIYVQGESFGASSEMSGDIDIRLDITEEENFDQTVFVDVEGNSDHEIDLSMRGVGAGVMPELSSDINLILGLAYYQGRAEIEHESDVEIYHSPDNELAEALELEDYQDIKFGYESNLELRGSLGMRLGANYNYQLTDNFSLNMRGQIRVINIDTKMTDRSYSPEVPGNILDEYFERDDFEFETPAEFEENLGGLEIGAALKYSF